VNVPPVITAQPQSVVTNAGATVAFSVSATAVPAPSYQWRRNSTNLAGATSSSYTISNVQTTHGGTYSVVVANTCGSTPSSNATLTVRPSYTFATLAGSSGAGSADGTGRVAGFYHPTGVAVDTNGKVYVADYNNHTIRKVTPAGVVTTLAGLASSSGSADGTGSAARFYYPAGVAVDNNGNVYVADQNNHTIRQVTPAGVVTTLAGSAGAPGTNDGTGSTARFNLPNGVAVDSNGSVYVADYSNHTIRQVTPTGAVTTLAGLAGSSGTNDGTGSAARFYNPTGVAVDNNGNIYVADQNNDTIRQVTPAGVVTTLAGLAGSLGSADGTGSAARFARPTGVSVDSSGNVYVADYFNHTIRQVTPARVVTTLAGLAGSPGGADGTGSAARFSNPFGTAVDTNGIVYVADSANNTIRKGAVSVGPPVILLLPQSQAVTQADTVTFSVVAAGTAPLSYQWRFNGTNISGASSNSYSLISAQLTNAGSYSVVVTNSVGSVTSSTANLSVAIGATLSFSSLAYSVIRSAGSASIFVIRGNVTNSAVSVNYATTNGTAVAGVDYSSVSGTLTFSSNMTFALFSVPILGGPASGDKTVLLSLSNPSGNASLVSPSSATLTILSPPVLSSAGFTTNGFAFRLLGPPGTYVMQASTNLADWVPVATNSTLTGLWDYTDPGATGVGRRFYRALLQ
jgi:sulfur carrier protein ThiS